VSLELVQNVALQWLHQFVDHVDLHPAGPDVGEGDSAAPGGDPGSLGGSEQAEYQGPGVEVHPEGVATVGVEKEVVSEALSVEG